MMISVPFQSVMGAILAVAMGATCLMWDSGPPDDQPSKAAQASDNPPGNKAIFPPPPKVVLPGEFNRVSMPDYVVQPPDVIIVEVLKALPDRPITGERLVRPDGQISLGYYGKVYVAGLTTTEIKEKVALHLRKFLDDATLGLEATKNGKTTRVDLKDSTCVFVDVVSYNSKVYYVQGDVGTPGRLPITGNETVLDALIYAGGLIPTASVPNIRLVRPAPPGACSEQILPVDLEAITDKGDPSTNYQMMPGDRLIVRRNPQTVEAKAAPDGSGDLKPIADYAARLKEVERKLDLILKKLNSMDKP